MLPCRTVASPRIGCCMRYSSFDDQLLARREVGDVLDLGRRHDLPVEQGALELDRGNVLGELRQRLGQRDGVGRVVGDGGHAGELLLERRQRRVLHRDQREGVLDDDVARSRVSRTCLRSSVTCGTVMPLKSIRNALVACADAFGELGDRCCFFFAIFMLPPYSAFASATAESMCDRRAHGRRDVDGADVLAFRRGGLRLADGVDDRSRRCR